MRPALLQIIPEMSLNGEMSYEDETLEADTADEDEWQEWDSVAKSHCGR